MAKLFRKNFIQAQISSPNEFCEKVFGSWDFAVKESAGEKYTELRTQFLVCTKLNRKYQGIECHKFIKETIFDIWRNERNFQQQCPNILLYQYDYDIFSFCSTSAKKK